MRFQKCFLPKAVAYQAATQVTVGIYNRALAMSKNCTPPIGVASGPVQQQDEGSDGSVL